MNLTVVLLAGGVFFFGVVAYVLFMVFLPEWVGITGKKAREAQDAHRGSHASGLDLLSRMQGENKNKPKNKDEDKA